MLIFNEKYRPETIEDCILPSRLKDSFLDMVERNDIQHMLFSGQQGIGKTSVAVALCKQLDIEYLLINSSLDNGIDTLRTTISDFASTVSMNGNIKVIILDEADRLSQAAQPALRGFIEEFHKNCRFILTANFPKRIIAPLRESRLVEIVFDIEEEEKKELQKEVFKRCMYILDQEGIEYTKNIVAGVIKKQFPDIRRIINTLQHHSKSGKLSLLALNDKKTEDKKYIKQLIESGDFVKLRTWANNVSKSDMSSLFDVLFEVVMELFINDKLAAAIMLLSEYQDKTGRAFNVEITLTAMMIELSELM